MNIVNGMRVRACESLVANLSSLKPKISSYFGHYIEAERYAVSLKFVRAMGIFLPPFFCLMLSIAAFSFASIVFRTQ